MIHIPGQTSQILWTGKVDWLMGLPSSESGRPSLTGPDLLLVMDSASEPRGPCSESGLEQQLSLTAYKGKQGQPAGPTSG